MVEIQAWHYEEIMHIIAEKACIFKVEYLWHASVIGGDEVIAVQDAGESFYSFICRVEYALRA